MQHATLVVITLSRQLTDNSYHDDDNMIKIDKNEKQTIPFLGQPYIAYNILYFKTIVGLFVVS